MQSKEKARLFHDLAQLVKSGVPFPAAVETLSRHARGESSAVLRGISQRLKHGDRVAEAIEAQTGRLDPLETGIIAASDESGTLEVGLEQCAQYYESLGEARTRIRGKLLYPIFILHFAALTTALPRAVGPDADINAALRSAVTQIVCIWLIVGAIVALSKMLIAAARGSRLFDTLLRNLPVFGSLRRAFAMSRFCAAYNMQLDAGINVFSSLDASGRASGSAVVGAAAERAVRFVREGKSIADGIGPTGAFPEPVVRAFFIGESTGSLDHELSRLAKEYRESALRRLEFISEWLPRMVIIGVAIYVGWIVVKVWTNYFKSLGDIIKG